MTSHSDVADAWFKGGCRTGHHMFTDGKVVYSYGRHFPIAVHLRGGKVLFNHDRYSVSTSTHQRHVLSAIRQGDIVYCSTSEIQRYIENPDEPLIITREAKPTELSSIMNLLRDYCKEKGVKRFPMEKLSRQIQNMIFVNQI